ncbi:hypothetical protein FOA43_004270 [Brettanomyces nanus]|uniref:Uncharacterized protein n=1 Tax=Eeniella nana TaxID=13502 RepID=A0A875S6B2_EENNA|nr:uncharacterized protein FOA43_004270 [Brettanomyces nanus]QPG76876.1 hypothetical protein FOA43_004270 [Brettanomyces nanus]
MMCKDFIYVTTTWLVYLDSIHPSMPTVYDSEDPNLPNLPDRDEVSWSDYDYLSDDSSSSDSSSIDSDRSHTSSIGPSSIVSDRRPSMISSLLRLHRSSKLSRPSSYKVHDLFEKWESRNARHNEREPVPTVVIQPTEEHQRAGGGDAGGVEGGDVGGGEGGGVAGLGPAGSNDHTSGLKPKPHRKYIGSKVKKERAAWEPGVDVHQINVLLNTPGSTVTISDYSENRYHIERYEVYSEMESNTTRKREGDRYHVEFLSGHRHDLDESSEASSNCGSLDELYQTTSEYIKEVQRSKEELRNALENKPKWGKVRWINVNGLSWEAISIIGDHYSLHRLAIEDMVDVPQRTKVDMYPSHLFAVMPLLKLITVEKPPVIPRSFFKRSNDIHEDPPIRPTAITATETALRNMRSRQFDGMKHRKNGKRQPTSLGSSSASVSSSSPRHRHFKTLSEKIMEDPNVRTLTDLAVMPIGKTSDSYQKLRKINLRRPLYSRNLGAGVEQLSLFLTTDGTVISFLEHSANDIEKAILPRLSSEYTILRTSCDPSILFESIIDSSVDLVYPVVSAYNKIMNEFEVDLLTNPGMGRTSELHLMVNELTLLRSTIHPISAMVIQLKDQKSLRKFITETSSLYLSDINDHLVSYIQDIDSLSQTIENMLNLVFNTLSIQTNNSMQRLSLITVIFLPLSFWTGYYGMNFDVFPDLHKNVNFYWELAIPFSVGLIIIIMRKELIKAIMDTKHSIERRLREYNYRRLED